MSVTAFYHPETVFRVRRTREACLARAREALAGGWYLECLTVVHSLMENYTYALLLTLGIPFKAADRMFQCLEYVKLHLREEDLPAEAAALLKAELMESGLEERLSLWRSCRNVLVHDFAIAEHPREEGAALAAEGLLLAEAYAAVAEKLLPAGEA